MSKALGIEHPKHPHLVRAGQGGVAGEVADLRQDVNKAFGYSESRASTKNYPEISMIDGGLPPITGGEMVIRGTNLLQGQSFAPRDRYRA